MIHKLHFSRFEFKYILPLKLRNVLEEELQYFVSLDPYVAQKEGNKYFVRSLYFDNQSFVNYYEKVDGLKHRSKFRLRTYTQDLTDDTPKFLEIKGRHNNLVFKHRANLNEYQDQKQIKNTLNYQAFHNTSRNIINSLGEGSIKDQFLYELYRKQLEPMVVVDYWRRPYISKFDPEFRLTFDDTLSGTVSRHLFPGKNNRSRSFLPGFSILEIKFRFHIPRWFHKLIQSLELRRVSISKFCAAVEINKMAPQLD